jgi:tetratricopeptide (TPR) repeat protein
MNRTHAAGAILFLITASTAHAELLDARSVLERVEKPDAAAQHAQSKHARLLADITAYRARARTLPPAAATSEWFALLDRAHEVAGTEWAGDYEGFDLPTRSVAGVRAVVASLPPPAAWPALRAEANKRVTADPQNVELLATRLLTEALAGDAVAMQKSIADIEAAAADSDVDEKMRNLQMVSAARAAVADLYGSSDEVIAAFSASVKRAGDTPYAPPVQVPDLVGMVGEARAGELLRTAVATSARLEVPYGDATRALARRTAIDNAASLRVPQWGLVDSIDGAELYEVLQQRFANLPQEQDEDAADAASGGLGYDYARRDAAVYYLLAKIIAKDQVKAERALGSLSHDEQLNLPKAAIQALQKAQQTDALVTFLHGALRQHPELQAWDVYIEQASYVGRSSEVLALVRELLASKTLSSGLRADLVRRNTQALLAADRVDEAIAQMRKQIERKPASGKGIAQSTETAVRLAEIGYLLGRSQLTVAGLAYAESSTALEGDDLKYTRGDLIQRMLAVYRRDGKVEAAQALALREFERHSEVPDQLQQYGLPSGGAQKRGALVEIVGLYSVQGRHADVLTLLNESQRWGARDLAELMTEPDSLGMPVGVYAARALAATGDRDAALSVLRALIYRLPGLDPAYELFTKLAGEAALAELDAMYARDQFEERPLIWKAQLLADAGKADQAESVIKQAIAIDPSDGEQGPNDRMRAYDVLARVLEMKGDRETARVYHNATAAIRVSENADRFHKVGLYDKAFALYRDALGRFADAYCVQSRLAIQLSERGRHAEALVHYRRAYELMPDSFGRVESHCFGCESVFKDAAAQSIAEQVFVSAIERDGRRPQAHYLLGYLREEQSRLADALQSFRNAVALDDSYLNAWKHLYDLGSRTYIDPAERDIARFKLFALDPRQRHVHYDLIRVRSAEQLWNTLESSSQAKRPAATSAFRLRNSADMYDAALAKLPPEIRMQMEQYLGMVQSAQDPFAPPNAQIALAAHAVIAQAGLLMGGAPNEDY